MTDDLATEPPTRIETELPGPPRLPVEAIAIEPERAPDAGYDPNSWEHVQLKTLVDAFRESKMARAAFDGEALIARAVAKATDHFTELTAEKLTLVLDELRGLNEQFQLLSGKVRTLQDESEGAKNRMAGYERELSGIKAELGRLTARVTELEALRGKLQDDTTQQAAASPR